MGASSGSGHMADGNGNGTDTTTGGTGGGASRRMRSRVTLEGAVVRFAGDSGDGMQLTGNRFTTESAVAGNDLATLPDFPAEIRAPAGTLAGVSSFQLQFSDHDIHTPGDAPDVLVAMNPAALRKHLDAVKAGGTLIVDGDAFSRRNLRKADYEDNPLEDGTLEDFQVHDIQLTEMTKRAVEELVEDDRISRREAERCKNMFALGLVSWMFSRPIADTEQWLHAKFSQRPGIAEANVRALKAGYHFGETTETFVYTYEVRPASLGPGRYRNITGTTALAYGLVAAGDRSGLDLFYGSYPITPASDILHELSRHKQFGVRTFQAEDEIAAVGSAIGAAFGGSLAVTASSGPGIALKTEAIGLALALELPLVVVDMQRGGPSTGLPTKSEQTDLLQVLFGRNGESPLPVVAAQSPSDCFYAALEAARIAVTHRTPVFLLADGYLANSSEPWLLPDVADLPTFDPDFATEPNVPDGFLPYLRDERLARPWALPGTPGLQHRIGGLEKDELTGNISYDPDNHHRMTEIRHARVERVADDLPPLEVDDPHEGTELLVVGWGSTYGPIRSAVRRIREHGGKVARVHLRHLSPLPADLGDVLDRYEAVLCPENNMGQLAMLLRSTYLRDVRGHNRVTGQPFRAGELVERIEQVLRDRDAAAPEPAVSETSAPLAAKEPAE